MAKYSIVRGATSNILHVFIQDSTSTSGAGKTGLAYNTANLACKKIRPGETLSASITLEDITTLGTYQAPTSNAHMRFKELNSASPTQGGYEIHLHNDWVDTTNTRKALTIFLGGATGMAQLPIEIELVAAEQSGDAYGVVNNGTYGNSALNTDLDTLLTRLVGTIAAGTHNPQSGDAYGVVNNGTYGNSALNTDLDTLLTRLVGTIAAGTHNPQSGDAYGVVNNGTYGNSALKTLMDAIKFKTDNLPSDPSSGAAIADSFTALSGAISTMIGNLDTAVAVIGLVTDKLDTTMEVDGGVYRFTTNALEMAPAGGGGSTINVLSTTKGAIQIAYAKSSGTVEVVQGDAVSIPYNLGKDLTGRRLYFAAKQALSDATYKIAVKEITGNITNVATGAGVIPITSPESNLPEGDYYAEIESRGADGTSSPVTELRFTLRIAGQVIKP